VAVQPSCPYDSAGRELSRHDTNQLVGGHAESELKDGPVTRVNTAHRKNERGITIVLVAFSLLALLGMAALAIDVSTLYVAHGEAQRAADAAALAGGRMFASSGYTTASTTLAAADICQTSATPGADAAANRQAEAVAAQNLVAGQPAAVQSVTCIVTAANPQIAVTVQRTALPTFFGRIWGGAANSVTATAVAEAYNPSGSTAPIQVQGVKPWLIPDCDPTNPPPGDCAAGGYFVSPIDGSIQNNGSFVGKTITLTDVGVGTPTVNTPPGTLNYYRATVPIRPPQPVCPSTSAVSCAQVGSDDYHDNIACSSTSQFSCGQTVGAGQAVFVAGGSPALTDQGTQCLIHASGQGIGLGQDVLTSAGGIAPPITIAGGDNNPNPALQGVTNISRSDSVVTVPIYHSLINVNLCPGGTCTGTGTIIGFLQLGITRNAAGGGAVEGVIMNVSGCNPGAGNPVVSGGGVSPIPVRLIHQ
jgi:putative Flp pilus-assembly TadE/G-like protein